MKSQKMPCNWCNEPTSEIIWQGYNDRYRALHEKCYALMYNYARRFQELKELLTQPDFVEVKP